MNSCEVALDLLETISGIVHAQQITSELVCSIHATSSVVVPRAGARRCDGNCLIVMEPVKICYIKNINLQKECIYLIKI